MRLEWIFLMTFQCIFCLEMSGQITGAVYDASGSPVPDAYIFIPGTKSWDITDQEGGFSLDWKLTESTELVCSHVAYVPQHVTLKPRDTDVRLVLTPANIEIDEVVIAANASSKRKQWLKKFTREFLGTSRNAKNCRIVNPEAILFTKTSDGLEAHATNLVEVENNALGYHLFLLLEYALLHGEQISYSIKPVFQEMEPVDAFEQKQREVKRIHAYRGSLTHFLRALIHNDLEAQGYSITHSMVQGGVTTDLGPADREHILNTETRGDNTRYYLSFNGFLKVTYRNEESGLQHDDAGNTTEHLRQTTEQQLVQNSRRLQESARDLQVSYLLLKKQKVEINPVGLAAEGNFIEEYGYMADERVAELIPLEFGLDMTDVGLK